MITNIPNKDEFFSVANHLLNTAWEKVIEIINVSPDHFEKDESYQHALSLSKDERLYSDNFHLQWGELVIEKKKQFWDLVDVSLASSIATLTQATEFYLKGKICEISPYLLVLSDPRTWPKADKNNELDFTQIKTVDAQDLLKIHDTTCDKEQCMGDRFKTWYDELRTDRNKFMHTVDGNSRCDPYLILVKILECHEFMIGKHEWVDSRMRFLNNDPVKGMLFIADDHEKKGVVSEILMNEISTVFRYLEPAQTKRFFNFRKKDRASFCPNCFIPVMDYYADDRQTHGFIRTLQKPEDSDIMSCFVCGHKGKYIGLHKNADEDDCMGDTADYTTGECLWCKE